MAIIYALIILIILCLIIARVNIIIDAYDDWNYYVYRYEKHCKLHYYEKEKPSKLVKRNYATKKEAFVIFLMFWKMDKEFFFSHKPDHDDILELYLRNR